MRCSHCSKACESVCSGCESRAFCSRECQVSAWWNGHKQECATLALGKHLEQKMSIGAPKKETKDLDPDVVMKEFTVALTGVRKGDLLLYTGKIGKWKGMVIEVLEGNINPDANAVLAVADTHRNELTQKLRNHDGFFASLSSDPVEWLKENAEEFVGFRADRMVAKSDPPLRIRLWDFGGNAKDVSPLSGLDASTLSEAMSYAGILASELEETLRVLAGTPNPPLLFFSHYWKTKGEMYLDSHVPRGELWLDMDHGTLSNEPTDVPPDRGVIHLDISRNERLHVIVDRVNQWKRLNIIEDTLQAAYLGHGLARGNTGVFAEYKRTYHDDFVGKLTEGFTAGAYKSLLQKMLRYGPEYVGLPDNVDKWSAPGEKDGRVVLSMACVALFSNRGSFNPDLGKFVRGTESFLKRIVVSAMEDSFISEKYSRLALRTLVAARITSEYGADWRPSRDMMSEIIRWALSMRKKPTYHDMDTSPHARTANQFFSVNDTLTRGDGSYTSDFILMSALLDDIKSLPGDLLMFRNVAHRALDPRYGKLQVKSYNKQPYFMPIWHCFDQHWYPAFLYGFDKNLIESFRTERGKTHYGEFFTRVFTEVSGLNWRKTKLDITNPSPFQRSVKNAQELAYFARRKSVLDSPHAETIQVSHDEQHTRYLSHTFHDAWLAGIVGQVQVVHNKRHFVATVNPENIQEIQVIVDPTRGKGKISKKQFGTSGMGSKDEDTVKATEKTINENYNIDPDTLDKVRDEVWAKLALSRSPVLDMPCASLKGAHVEVGNKEYKVGGIEWDAAKMCSEPIGPQIDSPDPSENILERFVYGIYPEGVGHMWFAESDLIGLMLARTEPTVLRRVLHYIGQFQTENAIISMPKINRAGEGGESPLDRDDVQAFHSLVELSVLYPNALQRRAKTLSDFVVKSPIALWNIRTHLMSALASEEKDKLTVSSGWLKHIRNQDLEFPHKIVQLHQKDSLDRMERRRANGFTGNFLWIPTGGGKTAIALQNIKNRIANGTMFRHVVYVLPQSAMRSVATEMSRFGFENVGVLWVNKTDPAEGTLDYIDYQGQQRKLLLVRQFEDLQPYTIYLINQDFHTGHFGQETMDVLLARASDTYLVYDEIHRAMASDTDRTKTAQALVSAVGDFALLSATPVTAGDTRSILSYVSKMVPFPVVHGKNDMVAINTMIRKVFDIGVDIRVEDKVVDILPQDYDRYIAIMPPALGGRNTRVTFEDFREAATIAYRAVDEGIMLALSNQLQFGGVFVVARDISHRDALAYRIATTYTNHDVFKAGPSPVNIESWDYVNKLPPIVVSYVGYAEGYNLQGLRSMITSAYPRNPAILQQIDGRVPRLGQVGIPSDIPGQRPYVLKTIVLAGLLVQLQEKKQSAKNLDEALKRLASEEVVDDSGEVEMEDA